MHIQTQIENIIDNLSLENNSNKAAIAKFINSNLDHFECYTAEELLQAVIDEVMLMNETTYTLEQVETIEEVLVRTFGAKFSKVNRTTDEDYNVTGWLVYATMNKMAAFVNSNEGMAYTAKLYEVNAWIVTA
jgi:hypothetical protein